MKNIQKITLQFTKSDESFEMEALDMEEMISDVRFAIKTYFEDVEEINEDELDKELTIDGRTELTSDSDETPETFNHETNKIGFKTIGFQVQNLDFEIEFAGIESDKLVDLYMEGVIEEIDANILMKLEDKSFELNSEPKPPQANKNKLTADDALNSLDEIEKKSKKVDLGYNVNLISDDTEVKKPKKKKFRNR